MPVINIPEKPKWYINRWEFRLLCERLESLLDSPEDKYFAQQADALHILTLGRFDDATEMRLARGLIAAAPVVRSEILAKEKTDQRDHECADLLLVLERDLRDAYGC